MNRSEEAVFNLFMFGLALLLFWLWLNRRKTSNTAHGSAYLMTEGLLKAWALLTGYGLIVGRSKNGSLITIPDYTHTLVIGGTGSGKGVGFVVPQLLTYRSGSLLVFDCKGDLKDKTSARRRQFGDTVVDLRSQGDADCLNVLDLIPPDSPTLIDDAAMLAAGMIVTEPGEKEPHWPQRARVILTAVLVYVLKNFPDDRRNLNTVQSIISVPKRLASVGGTLTEMGGIYERFGGHIASLFEAGHVYSKEGAGVIAVLTRHTSFLDSESVAACVSKTTFDPRAVLRPGMTVYLHIPPHRLDAQKNLLRLWVSTFVWIIGSQGSEVEAETFFMLDEASALGGLPAVREALVRGRSAGVRMALIYQSEDDVKVAYSETPNLIPDNCATQVFIGAPTSIESAKRRSEMVGDTTLEVVTDSTSYGTSNSPAAQGSTRNRGGGTNSSLIKRPLIDPSEMLKLGSDSVLVLHRGLPALILGRRIEYYRDPHFTGKAAKKQKTRAPWRWQLASLRRLPLVWRVVIGVGIWLGVMLGLRAIKNAQYETINTHGAPYGPTRQRPAKPAGPANRGDQGKVGKPSDR